MPKEQTAQQRFDAMYVGAKELEEKLKVDRATILRAVGYGKLPSPVSVGLKTRMYLWEREQVEPFLKAWMLQSEQRQQSL